MSTLDHTLKPEATAVRRLEVITGTGRRRQFSEDFKASIVEETLVPGAVISEVARRNGLSPQQVFTWRRQRADPRRARTAGRRILCRLLWRRRCQNARRVERGASEPARWIGPLEVSRWRLKASRCGSGAAPK